ncbi:hypothetical protein [Clostridium sp. ZS2]|uniref:hypothetical protein n=1 Tax=Clostridium sp. ZS2 TaxID=2949988 RepID=UPI00207928C0|nr:hypothetical protein [Clostridium sp. ZS2]
MKNELKIKTNIAIKEVKTGIITKQEWLILNAQWNDKKQLEEAWNKISNGHNFMIENYDQNEIFSVEYIDNIIGKGEKNE